MVEERTSSCGHCGRTFRLAAGPGRPQRYCRRSCRQRAYERRTSEGDQEWVSQRYRQLSAVLAEHEDALDRVKGVLDELRRDVADEMVIDGADLVARLDEALR